jgi:hypothetical protein
MKIVFFSHNTKKKKKKKIKSVIFFNEFLFLKEIRGWFVIKNEFVKAFKVFLVFYVKISSENRFLAKHVWPLRLAMYTGLTF